MIALGGTIGVGLFMGQQVQLNGLAHQLFCVFNRRDILILIMRAMGEMIYLNQQQVHLQHLLVNTYIRLLAI